MKLPRVVSLTEYKAVKGYVKLLSSYASYIDKLPEQGIHSEIIKWQEERRKHPRHYLVLVKGRELFENYLRRKIPPDKRDRAERLLSHVEATLEDRLEYKEQEASVTIPDGSDNEPNPAS